MQSAPSTSTAAPAATVIVDEEDERQGPLPVSKLEVGKIHCLLLLFII